jgi:S-adenosylmethionine synthetase
MPGVKLAVMSLIIPPIATPATTLFTSEAVGAGHPDKVADQLSDAILDAYLTHDPHARVASEVLVTTGSVILAGETRTHVPGAPTAADLDQVVRSTIANIGYTDGVQEGFEASRVHITDLMQAQSAEIAMGVDAGDRASEGAGDQGIMFGYACTETPELMPAALHYSHAVLRHLGTLRRTSEPGLRPDAKAQLTLEYVGGTPVRAHTVLVSHQHAPTLKLPDLKNVVMNAWETVLPHGWLDANTRILVNPTGSFTHGGPSGDTGLTGRKIIVDSYGGAARHGGGAFSGKDPTKVDRSAAYAARYLAKNVVAAGLATRCEIQLAYAIGVAEPLAIYVECFGTHTLPPARLQSALMGLVSLTPRAIRERFNLTAPIYLPTASGGHFGRPSHSAGPGTFLWEQTDLVPALLAAVA